MRKKQITAMLLAAFLFTSMALFAQDNTQAPKAGVKQQPPMAGMQMGMLKGLNLTDEQKEKVKQLNFDRQKEMIKIQSDIQLKRVELKEILAEKQVNTSKLTTVTEAIGKLELQINKLRTENWIKVNSLLNDDQKQIWKNHFERGGFRNAQMSRGMRPGRMGMMQGRQGERMVQGRPGEGMTQNRMGQRMHQMGKTVEKEVIIEKK